MNPWRYRLKTAALIAPYKLRDHARNLWHVRDPRRILITRHVTKSNRTQRDFLQWVVERLPELAVHLQFLSFPCRMPDLSRCVLHASWMGDRVDLCLPDGYRGAQRLAEACRQRGIPQINPVDTIPNTGKARCAQLLRDAGIYAPRSVEIRGHRRLCDALADFRFPVLIREERAHHQPTVWVESPADLERVDLSSFARPIASEFIDTCCDDGLYRKYRVVMAGDVGVTRHMVACREWEVRPLKRVFSDAISKEELEFLNNPWPHHHVLSRAMKTLGLDVAGFDISFDRDGQSVIWEVNSFPDMNLSTSRRVSYLRPAGERVFAALARLYLQRAGLPMPYLIDAYLGNVASRSHHSEYRLSVDRIPASTSDNSAVAQVGQFSPF